MTPMSESDQNWNAAGDEPSADPNAETFAPPTAPPVPAASDHAWPQYSWTGSGPAPAAPGAAVEPPAPATVSWPPTQPTLPTNPTIEFAPLDAPGPSSAGSQEPGPASAIGAGGGGAWGPPPSGWAAPAPGSWPPGPPVAETTPTASAPKRGLAIVAVIALVLASAGIGAGVAVALHDSSKTTPFSASRSLPFDNGNSNSNGSGSGSTNGNGFGNGSSSGGTGSTTPPSGSLDVNAIADKVDPALVNINTTLAQGRAAGTGMLISSTGEILTNNHVIADATSIKVVIGGKGASHDAKVVGYDVTEDVALLQITDSVKDLPTIVFGDPSGVKVGDPVVAIGNAGGVGGTPSATEGQVTALDQQVTASDGQGESETLEGMIQIDAPIQPGDSGGALIDSSGRIIGMNTAAAGGGQFSQNSGSDIGFAIPIDNAVNIVSQIRSGNETSKVFIGDRGLLGVQIEDINGQSAPVSSGALVVGVENNSGADEQGIQTGDVIVEANGKPVTDSASLRTALGTFHAGESVSVSWVDSSGNHHDASVKLVPGPPL
jgi:S1-C subfamily serine protease